MSAPAGWLTSEPPDTMPKTNPVPGLKEAPASMCASRHRLNAAATLVAGLTLLAGCEGTFTNDLATHPPADPAIAEVRVSLLGLQFELSGGGTRTLDFRDGEPVDLIDFVDGDPMRMFTDEALDPGDYTGVRLLFDEDFEATVVDTEGVEFPLTLQDGEYADLNFAVADDERSSDAYTLTLDLRQSLVFDDANDEFTLTPALRAVKSSRTADLTGRVTVECPDDESLERDGAVYLFAGRDVVPDDLDGTEDEML
ncbi:MAG: lipoprotein [Steroidobacteraceae bacterium]|nr:lipoprotein [Steroidobacteraceae bacterium]